MDSDQDNSNFDRGNGQDDDDDYDFAEDQKKGGNNRRGGDNDEKTQKIENHHYDEAVEISEGGSEIPSDPDQDGEQGGDDEPDDPTPPQQKPNAKAKFEPLVRGSADSDANDEDGEDKRTAGQYDPSIYANLDVSAEVKDLFKYITRFRPQTVELDTKLKAFIPDYIPAVGEVDAFIKPPRPDNQAETLGLLTIDEPCLNQSKESTMRVIIQSTKIVRPTNRVVDSIENADKNPKDINRWIHDVASIQRQAPSVVYSKAFPDIENLMQVWPAEIEDAFQGLRLPTEDIDMSLEEYSKLCCALVDIPVHQPNNPKSVIESLHVFFTLYDEFRANQHFQQQNEQFVYEGTGGF